MKSRWLIIPAAVLLLAATLWVGSSAAVTAGPSPDRLAAMSPQAVTGEFYTWYVDMLDAGVLAHPLLDGTYQNSDYLSNTLVSTLDALVDDSCGCGLAIDPVLCTADVPQQVGTRVMTTEDDAASVLVYGRYPTESLVSETRILSVASLIQQDGHWVVDGVTCR